MLSVTIYTTGPACIRCTMTKKRLDKAGISYKEIDVRQDETAREYIAKDLGYSEAPVCIVEDGTEQNHWSGYRPDMIDRIPKHD
ncbi:glutaredoxin domain-containing protein [Dermabacteraceae bacterium P13101]